MVEADAHERDQADQRGQCDARAATPSVRIGEPPLSAHPSLTSRTIVRERVQDEEPAATQEQEQEGGRLLERG